MLKWLLVAVVVVPGACADVLNTIGMKRYGEIEDLRPGAMGRMIAGLRRNRYVLTGLGFAAISFCGLLALLSVAEVSFAVPSTAASYLLETVLAKYILKEHITGMRWTGALLVAGGVALLSR